MSKKGQSGNPAGRRAQQPIHVRNLARKHTKPAIKKLVEIMNGDDIRAAGAAASVLLDRGWGKPATMVALDEGTKGKITFVMDLGPDEPELKLASGSPPSLPAATEAPEGGAAVVDQGVAVASDGGAAGD